MLDFEDTSRERLRGIIVEHLNCPLCDDRTVIVLFIGDVDGHARHFHARGNDRFVDVVPVHPLPSKTGQERGMDVEHTVPIRLDDPSMEFFHVASHDDQIGLVFRQDPQELIGKGFRGWELVAGEVKRRDAIATRPVERARFTGTTDNSTNTCVQPAGLDRVDDGLQIRPAPGDEDGKV